MLQIIQGSKEHSTLNAALHIFPEIEPTLDSAKKTIVAPNDAAFAKLGIPAETLLVNKNKLKKVLMYHVTTKSINSQNVNETHKCVHDTLLEGSAWTHFYDEDDAEMVIQDALKSNAGILKFVGAKNNCSILVVDTVLLPARWENL